jgi:hypothetical protein
MQNDRFLKMSLLFKKKKQKSIQTRNNVCHQWGLNPHHAEMFLSEKKFSPERRWFCIRHLIQIIND